MPLSQMGPAKYLAIMLDDLWLYSYDRRTYRGKIKLVFAMTV